MWWFHFWHLAWRSWAQVLTWLGTTTLAILLNAIVLVVTFVITVRVTTGQWLRVAVLRNQARDLKTLGITMGVPFALTLAIFVFAVSVTVLRDHNDLVAANARLISETRKLRAEKEPEPHWRRLPHFDDQPSVEPDESNRARALRDQHYQLLRPVLKSESAHLKVVAEQVGSKGHFAPILEDELPWWEERKAANSPSAELWPEVMSRDLANHFGEYDEAKHKLLSEINGLDSEFRQAMSQIKPAKDLTPDWTEMAALSFVKKCLGLWDGLHYLRRYGKWAGMGFSRPSPEEIAAKVAYQSIEPTAMGDHCESLKRRADKVKTTAENLSKQAILLSEQVVLNGTCQFLKKVD